MPHNEGLYSTTASPGDGVAPIPMSSEPLATEGEATPGPDDYNPFQERVDKQLMEQGQQEEDELFSMVPANIDFGMAEEPDFF